MTLKNLQSNIKLNINKWSKNIVHNVSLKILADLLKGWNKYEGKCKFSPR